MLKSMLNDYAKKKARLKTMPKSTLENHAKEHALKPCQKARLQTMPKDTFENHAKKHV